MEQINERQLAIFSDAGWPKRYVPKEMLNDGHDGVCYLSDDVFTKESVVVKMLKPKRARRVTEPEIMADLSHDNVLRQREHVIVASNINFLVLDYCENGDLCEYVFDRQRLDEREARRIFKQIVGGLSYLHQHGICHRDLKVDNVFLDKQLNAKIGDFGAACRFDPHVELIHRYGTRAYHAPELLQDLHYYGDRVDCWALGVTLYVMLVGGFPFKGNKDLELLWQTLRGPRFPADSPVLTETAMDLIRLLVKVESSQRATLLVVNDHLWMRSTSTTESISSTETGE
jgi:serine/threonine protein kinase